MPRHNGNTRRKSKKRKKNKGIVMPRTGVPTQRTSGGGYHKDKRTKRQTDQDRRYLDEAYLDYEEWDYE